MKLKKLMGMALVSSLAISSLVACGDEETNSKATLTPQPTATTAPTNTPVPTSTPEPTPTPTTAPTEAPKDPNLVFSYDASAKSQALYFQDRGGARARWINTDGHDSSECFSIIGRTESWHGVSLTIPNECIGKVLHVSYWAKHEVGEPIMISATLQVTKPDGNSGWPERANNDAVPSGEWVLIENDVPVYADVTNPVLCWEATDTNDFCIDDVVITIVEGATAEAQYQDLVVDKPDTSAVDNISLTFNDENLFFGNRGDGTPAIVSGGHDDDFAMQVTGRTATWNGAEVDLSSYNLAGRTLNISYWVKVEEATEVNVTLQEDTSDGADTAYNRVASSGDLTPGEWTQVTGTVEVGANTVKPVLYFESPSETASFTVDEVVISFSAAAAAPLEDISLTFNDENLFFGNRGDGTPAIVSGGHDDDFAMQVTGRTSSWNGAEFDFSDYNLAGKTVNISYWVKVEEATEVNITLQEDTADGGDTAYNRVASSGELTPGEWTQVTGTITVGENTVKPILYFESPSDTASFTVDEVVISFN